MNWKVTQYQENVCSQKDFNRKVRKMQKKKERADCEKNTNPDNQPTREHYNQPDRKTQESC